MMLKEQTLELETDTIYYLQHKDGKPFAAIHFGADWQESADDMSKAVNVNIDPVVYGCKYRVVELHQYGKRVSVLLAVIPDGGR